MNPATVKRVSSPQTRNAITNHWTHWHECKACGLCDSRRQVVLWRGNLPCDVLFVGEAPGPPEDHHGVPFVGPAGHVLNDAIAAVRNRIQDCDDSGYDPSSPLFSYAVTNVVACFPQTSAGAIRLPTPKEIEACRPRLKSFITIAQPKLIIALGKTAAVHLGPALESAIKLPKHILKGKTLINKSPIPVVDLIHPSAVNRVTEDSRYATEFAKLAVPMHDAILEHVLKGGG